MERHAVHEPQPRAATVKIVKDVKADAVLTRGLAAAFGGTTSEEEQERESPSITGLSRSWSCSLVVCPA